MPTPGSGFGRLLQRLYEAAVLANEQNITRLVEDRPYAVMCDLGCDDGDWTARIAAHARSKHVFGVELVSARALLAHSRGIDVTVSDLGKGIPFLDGSIDLVHANQVIEHVSDVDLLLSETKRILRVGGVAIFSTENGSSWHNIVAAALGWQIFSLTNVSALRSGIGNPLALHRGDAVDLASWTHKTIFNYQGLIEIFEVHGLSVVRALGAGYYPLPSAVGRLDVRHAHFVSVKAIKRA